MLTAKIGEILIQRGLITRPQLKEALAAQLIYGGHLGTCLMELGYITEQALGSILAEIHDVEYAPPACLENIPRYVVATLSEPLATKTQAMPFRLQGRTLDVALVDPTNLVARDELSFASGYKIRSWVAPEARILQAMERYYDVPRRLRYITLCREPARPAPADSAATAAPTRQSSPSRRLPDGGGLAVAAPVVAVAERLGDSDSFEPVVQFLLRAQTVDDVAKIILDRASRTLGRCLVFLVQIGRAVPWQARGIPVDPSRWGTLSLPVTTEPVFALLNGEDLYRGPIPRETSYRRFYEQLELDLPKEALIVPAHVDDRLVALLYGDGGSQGVIRGENSEYRRLVKLLALGLDLVQLRRRMTSTLDQLRRFDD